MRRDPFQRERTDRPAYPIDWRERDVTWDDDSWRERMRKAPDPEKESSSRSSNERG